jgi:hypothetical protein
MSIDQTGIKSWVPSPITRAPGYFGAIATNGPISAIVLPVIATAPPGITPAWPNRGSVIAWAPRMMIVSAMMLLLPRR